ncbi:MAG: DUF2007 domain-containing protein [Bacteroidales bacterium]|nr:DUF2007 domain-containing protein [Bacteroidales bacterium]
MKEDPNIKFVAAAEFWDVNTAHIVEQMLIANGIEAIVMGDVSPYPVINIVDPVKVMVQEKDLEQAQELIGQSSIQ